MGRLPQSSETPPPTHRRYVARWWPPFRVCQQLTSVSVSACVWPGTASTAENVSGKQAMRVHHSAGRWQHWHMCCWTRETFSGSTQALFLSMQKWAKHDEPSRLWARPRLFDMGHLPVTQICSQSPQEPVVDDVLVNGVQTHPLCLKRPS